MKIAIEIDERTLRQLVYNHILAVLGDVPVDEKDITIEVKSTQNYRSEWEPAAFRATVNKNVV